METKLALLGPPGVGKSSLIRSSLDHSIRAVDGESFWEDDHQQNVSVLRALGAGTKHLLLGGAGFSVDDCQAAGFDSALLYMPQQAYAGRRARRDSRHPEKSGQREHDMEDWLANWSGNFIFDASLRVEVLVSGVREYLLSGDPQDLKAKGILLDAGTEGAGNEVSSRDLTQPQAEESLSRESNE